jgi:hypothetical protein
MPPLSAHDGTMATKLAFAATRSFREEQIIRL